MIGLNRLPTLADLAARFTMAPDQFTLLIAGDDGVRRAAVAAQLADVSWKLVEARSAPEALDIAEAGVDLVIAVEPLSALAGRDFAEALRALAIEMRQTIPLLRIANDARPPAESARNPASADIVTTLGWPVPPEALRATIDLMSRLRAAQTALMSARRDLQAQADTLEQKVEERTATLRDSISQMEEFSYSVSHDLRAPLRSIKGYAELLLSEYGHRLRGDGPRYLERIVESGDRMEKLVNDVLKISRISSTKLRLQPIDLNALLETMIREYPNLNVESSHILVEKIPLVIGHDSLCTQVFANLLGNAVKFVREGVVPQINISALSQGGLVKIIVSDNGIGVSPEYHQKIFGMFERLDPENRYGGTGIGLAIVRRAAEKMNGRVGIESDGQNGSRFWIELPAAT